MYYIDRRLVKQNAREALKANYWPIVGWMLLGGLIIGACSTVPGVGFVATIFVMPVMSCGLCYFSYVTYCGQKADAKQLFAGFSDKFMHIVGGYWWMMLFTFLWSLLFVIPGIVKGISYSMTPYILIDQPQVGARDALKLSMDMTRGHKWEIFVMYLSFIGWAILCAITFGIVAVFYAGPYYDLTAAGYYYELKAIHENGGEPAGDEHDYDAQGNLAFVPEKTEEVKEPETEETQNDEPEPEMADLEFPDAPVWPGVKEEEPEPEPEAEPEDTDGD